MPRFPGFGFPFQYYNPYRQRPFYNSPIIKEEKNKSNQTYNKNNEPNEKVWLDLFGIKLYFDDVLILSLLFFLYKEDVKDEGLFLALILLLIS